MALAVRKDPFLAFNFLVEIQGLVVAGFTEVTGLQVEIEVESYREGGRNEYIHRLAGPALYPSNLVLKRGLTDIELWSWHQNAVRGAIERKNGSIVLLDAVGVWLWRWNFVEAYPVKWIGPEFRASAPAVAVETLELVHRGIYRAT